MQDRSKRVFTYIRVSTGKQVERGYSMEEQRHTLDAYAKHEGLYIVDKYEDKGKTGKNLYERDNFRAMMERIKANQDNVGAVLITDISRFGRNAADSWGAIQDMEDYGVFLIAAKQKLDTSNPTHKFSVQMYASIAEMEVESIQARTMAGRNQKARDGRWNGGFAPYGYKLVPDAVGDKKHLEIEESEAEVIRIIFKEYADGSMGCRRIANWLNDTGHKKVVRQNGSGDIFSETFVRGVLDNPVYMGKISYNRRKTEKIQGTRNKTHVVKQDEYDIYEGLHEGIVSEELWYAAQARRKKFGGRQPKTHDLEHEHLLSGIIKCPVCGDKMLPNLNRNNKRLNKQGEPYPTIFYYQCRHKKLKDIHPCTFSRSIRQDTVNAEVEQIVAEAWKSPMFLESMYEMLNQTIDKDAIQEVIDKLERHKKQLLGSKAKLEKQMDMLSIEDPHYDAKYEDMQKRLDAFYDNIAITDKDITEQKQKMIQVYQGQASLENAKRVLQVVSESFHTMSDKKKKTVFQEMLDSVEIFPEKLPDGRWVKAVHFKFPVVIDGVEDKDWYTDGTVDDEESGDKKVWNNEAQDETVCCLYHQKKEFILVPYEPKDAEYLREYRTESNQK